MIRTPVLVLGCLVTMSAAAAGQAALDSRGGVAPALSAELLRVRESVWRAWFGNDRSALEASLPEHVIAINNGDTTWENRAAVLQSAASFQQQGGKLIGLVFPRTEFQVFGDIAILYSLFEIHLEQSGQSTVQRGRATEVFIRRGGRWLNAGWHLDSGS